MRFQGKVTSVNLNEQGGSLSIQDASSNHPAGPGAAPGGGGRSMNVNFGRADSDGYARLVGKQVTVEILEIV